MNPAQYVAIYLCEPDWVYVQDEELHRVRREIYEMSFGEDVIHDVGLADIFSVSVVPVFSFERQADGRVCATVLTDAGEVVPANSLDSKTLVSVTERSAPISDFYEELDDRMFASIRRESDRRNEAERICQSQFEKSKAERDADRYVKTRLRKLQFSSESERISTAERLRSLYLKKRGVT